MKREASSRDRAKRTMKAINGKYHGSATMVHFEDCDAILVAANMRDLRKIALRFFYMPGFDPKKTKRVTVERRK